MTRETPHHGWTVPTEGETENWDEVLNTFFEDELDQQVVLTGLASERPAAGDDGPMLYFAHDAQRFDFNDGLQWVEDVAGGGGGSSFSGSHDDLTNVSGDDHHTRYANSEARDAVGNQVSDGLDYNNGSVGMAVVATGNATLSSGAVTISTGVSTSETATFMVALGPDTDDADVGADVRSDASSGVYEVDIQETGTSVGNPTVEYDIVRVR